MISERQLPILKDRIAHLEAVVDGSEAQTREATAYVVGIVTRFLHEKALIDERALRYYVRTFEGDASDDADYMGELVRRLGDMIDFHDRHPAEFDLTGGVQSGRSGPNAARNPVPGVGADARYGGLGAASAMPGSAAAGAPSPTGGKAQSA